METSLKTGFAQIFSCCPKNLSCPKCGGAPAPLARTPMRRFLKILKIKKLTDVKNGSEYIGKKGNPIYNDIKRRRIFKNQNNFLTFKLSTV